MNAVEIIHKKKSGEELTEQEIRYFIGEYTKGGIPDYQMSAFTMAVCFRGMSKQETIWMTDAMVHSGETMDLSQFGDNSADKHSTGGVGDKTTMIVAPIVAALGGKMAKMSGRGLGHTGGTVDKLESIPGYRVTLSPQEFLRQVEKIGLAVIGQSGNLTPADKKIYALRDVTDTVDSLPLIASSIMSKKIASGAKNIVLDVKVGSGAFMHSMDSARELAVSMVEIGKKCGRNVTAVLTNMDIPLGTHIGNALEVMESAEVLKGRGSEDLAHVSSELASYLISMVRGISVDKARVLVQNCISSGEAFLYMKKWIGAQGGNPDALEDYSLLPKAKICHTVLSKREGFLEKIDAQQIGTVSRLLGAGRLRKEDALHYGAGIILKKKTGDYVQVGEPIAEFFTDDEAGIPECEQLYFRALQWDESAPLRQPLILGVIR